MIRILRKCSLSVRMAALILLFVAAMLAVFFIHNATMQRVEIRGPLYNEIVQGKDLVADILPPPEYIIESYLTSLQLLNEQNTVKQEKLIAYGNDLKDQYMQRHAYWQEVLPKSDLSQTFLVDSYNYAIRFYELWDKEFVPDIRAGNTAKAKNAATKMEACYDLHRAEIDKVVAAANDINAKTEVTAESSIQSGNVSSIVTIIAAILALLGFSYVISISITSPVKALVKVSEQLALGDINVRVDARSNDEVGKLAKSFDRMIEGVRAQTESSRKISQGDIFAEVAPRSADDVLSYSLGGIALSLRELYGDTMALVEAIRNKDFAARGDLDKYQGYFSTMMAGTNELLELVERYMAESRKQSDVFMKMDAYQKNETLKVVRNLEALAHGELSCDLTVADTDEDTHELGRIYGDISSNLHAGVEAIRGYMGEISHVLKEMAAGNLGVGIRGDYRGDFTEVKLSLNAIIESMNVMLGEVSVSADQVATGTSQVSSGAQTLSRGALDQAGAIQQLMASIEHIAGQSRRNATMAGEASRLSAQARSGVLAGNDRMGEMLRSMEDIKDSSASISKIIKVIDDIAFQTNLLALNAAVESARAGEQGRGFAVVAEEVRSLALRSSEAAKETAALIEGTIRKVKGGMAVANETAAALKDIVNIIGQATDLSGSIASASDEQASAVEQVNRGIEQVSMVVQTTSATAEESAATSEEISAQAVYLREMVGKFRLGHASNQ